MADIYVRVRGIVKKEDKYLLIKHWVDDRIPDPYLWEFVEGEVNFGEAPKDAVIRWMNELLGVSGTIEKVLYTWSKVTGDSQCVGIAFLCSMDDEADITLTEEYGEWQWVTRDEFEEYISNQYVLDDLIGVEL
ncbi:MAG: NUDIX hydrolase [Lachnospiraceae bacterium]|nr:NUDIX hydrolase [Lachnospiraceae bacterium]